jgi:hypothetical protein
VPAWAEAHAEVVTRSGCGATLVRVSLCAGGEESNTAVLADSASERVTVASDSNEDREGAENEDGDAEENVDENDSGWDSMASTAATTSALDAASGRSADGATPGADDPNELVPNKPPATRSGPSSVRPMTTMAATANATGRYRLSPRPTSPNLNSASCTVAPQRP